MSDLLIDPDDGTPINRDAEPRNAGREGKENDVRGLSESVGPESKESEE